LGSSSVDCNYINYSFYAVVLKYGCYVSNNLNISSPESATIIAVNGAHESGKSNIDEIYFHAESKHIEYFPRGLEKFFTNLTGIGIYDSKLKEIHQDDLKLYKKLKYLSLLKINIEIIEDGLFDYQPDIESIIFENMKIIHISSTVFDNLPKLTTLYLGGNKCTSKSSINNRAGVLEVIKSAKSTCISSDFLKLDEKLKNLEENYKSLNSKSNLSFYKVVDNFEAELENSKFSKFQSLKERVSKISDWKLLVSSDKIESLKNFTVERLTRMEAENSALRNILSEMMKAQNATESKDKLGIQNPWMIIAIGVVGFSQTIILAVIFKHFVI